MQKSGWTEEQKAWALHKLQMPLPPFHKHMHMASCQVQNGLERVAAGGTGIGEPTEQMNRFMGLAGVVLQYVTLAARALWLEVLFSQWNRRKAKDLPSLLVRAAYRSHAKKAQLVSEQDADAKGALRIGAELNKDMQSFTQEVGDNILALFPVAWPCSMTRASLTQHFMSLLFCISCCFPVR